MSPTGERDVGGVRHVLTDTFALTSVAADPELFVGRRQQLIDLAQALHARDLCPIILGEKGIGKSTLARQVELIAKGSTELLEALGAQRFIFGLSDHYLTLYLMCSEALTPDRPTILRRLMVEMARMEEDTAPSGPRLELAEETTKLSISAKPGYEHQRKYVRADMDFDDDRLGSLEQRFLDLATTLTTISRRPLLFVLDDLQRMSNTTGIAALVREISTITYGQVKFLLVATGQYVSQFLSNHEQLEGLATLVEVPKMSALELQTLVRRILARLARHGVAIRIGDSLIESLATMAVGSPFTLWQLTRDALYRADVEETDTVSRAHVDSAVASMIARLRSGR
jgi:hypothetical protein